MNALENFNDIRQPEAYQRIAEDSRRLGFDMPSEPAVGCLLRTLAASKPRARCLELGTGTGLASSWLLDGMCPQSTLLTVDNDPMLLAVARRHLGSDPRVEIVCDDGDHFLQSAVARGDRFDLVFADTWSGKYRLLDEALALLAPQGFYVIDDMLPQPNWPEGHGEKVAALLAELDRRSELTVTRMAWSCGVVIGVRR
jgi:predicted O-methyltransferase YrrM